MQTQTQTPPRTTVSSADGKVVLTNVKFKCQGPCGKWKSGSEIGLRKMGDGGYRNQSRCRDCRNG